MSQLNEPVLFVSHHGSKRAFAQDVERGLNAHGVRCWLAPRDVAPGDPVHRAVRKAIADSDAVLLLFCSEAAESAEVKRELILADQLGKAIIPLRLERVGPGALAHQLPASRWIEWQEPSDAVIEHVAAKARFYQEQASCDDPEETGAPPAPDRSAGKADGSPAPIPDGQTPGTDERAEGRKSLTWLWITLGGVVVTLLAALAIWFFALRGDGRITNAWLAGEWSDNPDCEIRYRYGADGLFVGPDGGQGEWGIEDGNRLVVAGPGGRREIAIERVSDDKVITSEGPGYRCR